MKLAKWRKDMLLNKSTARQQSACQTGSLLKIIKKSGLFLLLLSIPIAGLVLANSDNKPELILSAKAKVPTTQEEVKLSFAPVVREAAPAVVNVYVRHKIVRKQFESPLLRDPFFRHFFGNKFRGNKKRMKNSLGSGVILRPNGIVVTNYHVIKGGENGDIKVALQDKREFTAHIILQDEETDLAILKINNTRNEKFPFLRFSNSDDLNVGDLVLAIGNPFGVGQTVTSGIISALARTQVGRADFQSFIQTDAAINPGNSGGALVDMHGNLVGINTAIYSRSGGSNGIGFAIPSNMVRLVVNSALKGKKVTRPWFGAKLQPLTPDLARTIGLDRPSGALLTSVYSASPAQIAGLKSGDVIQMVGGHKVDDPRSFHYRFATMEIGGTAELTIFRNGQTLKKNITLIAAPYTPPPNIKNLRGNHPLSGARIANLSPGLSDEIDVDDVEGVVITNVIPRSYAAGVGFRKKDIIVSLNNTPILSVRELQARVNFEHRVWRIEIKRGKRILRLVLPGN